MALAGEDARRGRRDIVARDEGDTVLGCGVAAIGVTVPLNMLSRWMGHAALETTAIYANALGEEQRSIAERMWK